MTADELQGIWMKDMRLKGFCLAPVDAQRASGKPYILDPSVVRFDPDGSYPVLVEFAGEPIGQARISPLAGGLLAEVELGDELPQGVTTFAIGGIGKFHLDGKERIWDWVELQNIAVTRANADPGLTPFEVEPA